MGKVRTKHVSVTRGQHTGDLVLVSTNGRMGRAETYSRRDEILADHCDGMFGNAKGMHRLLVMDVRSVAMAVCREMTTETLEAGMPRLGSCCSWRLHAFLTWFTGPPSICLLSHHIILSSRVRSR